MRRTRLLAAASAAVMAAAGTAVGVLPAHAAPSCAVSYTVSDSWPGGFQAGVTIENTGDDVSSWTLRFELPTSQTVNNGWNGVFSQSGQDVVVDNAAWNGELRQGDSASIGFVGSTLQTGGPAVPASFSLNGTTCATDGGTGPDPEPTEPEPTEPEPTEPEPTEPEPTEPEPTEPEPTEPTTPGDRVGNPYAGVDGWYVNPEWAEKVRTVDGGDAIADQPTALWLDRIAAIDGTPDSQSNGPWGLRDHLDEALRQQEAAGGGPFVFQFVTYNLPARDCAALASNGELGPDELPRYRDEYIDPITEILADPKYSSLRIVTVVEVDSLPNLITNAGQGDGSTPLCEQVLREGQYVDGIQYALDSYATVPNVYAYLDAGHHGWLGWDTNSEPAAQLLAETITESDSGGSALAGFIVNTSNYTATKEPYIPFPLTLEDRQSDWIDFNVFADATTFSQSFREQLIDAGLPDGTGILIDTSRNGWGGPDRPDGTGETVDERRIDRRIHLGNWCNQAGAGIGERPQAAPEANIDAYVWIKPPGESDGASREIDNDDGKSFDRMCDPTYQGNARNGNNPSGALPDAPIAGAFFPEQLEELIDNAYPPLP